MCAFVRASVRVCMCEPAPHSVPVHEACLPVSAGDRADGAVPQPRAAEGRGRCVPCMKGGHGMIRTLLPIDTMD